MKCSLGVTGLPLKQEQGCVNDYFSAMDQIAFSGEKA